MKIYKISLKNLNFNFINNLTIIFVFFLTLQSFYYEKISLSLFPVVGTLGIFLIAILGNYSYVNKNILSKFLIFLFFSILLQFLIGIIDLFLENNPNSFFAAIINLTAMFSIFLIFHKDKAKLIVVLSSVTVLHLFFFYFQVVVWFATDYYVDYVNLLSDDYSVYSSLKGLILFDQRIPRFTGLFNEPSSYSTWFFSIFTLYYLAKKRFNWIIVLGLLSLLVTMSLLGGILAISFMFIVFLKDFKKHWIIILIPLLILLILFYIELNQERFSSNYVGLDYRFAAIENLFKPSVFLFGEISGQSCGYKVHISFLTTLVCKGGLFYGLIFLIALFFSRAFSSYTFFCFISLILISKIKLIYPVFWIYLVIIFILSNFNLVLSDKHFKVNNAKKP